MKKLELLAPAKDLEHGKAAINHGADAVYIGAPKFSARQAAGTDLIQIESLATYAHLYYAKVYVALNTILFESELGEVQQLIQKLYEAGIDALIIQDMGILEMELPPLPLFASTQTHNASVEKVQFLEKVGFKRIILARELSLEQITQIGLNTSVELESFVHGALCISYSGQCYMSQAICERSGNRGTCAQPCRSAYDLVDDSGKVIQKNKHLLSLKDINLSNEIPNLVKAGISSFKIEGRLKDMAYIKNITAHYRNKIDSFLEKAQDYKKASSGKCSFNFIPDPNKTFNRGYTNYFINGRKEKTGSFLTQKSLGAEVGKVIKVTGREFIYEGEPLSPGDGICFFKENGELSGFLVNKTTSSTIIPNNISEIVNGAVLYRNFDLEFENKMKRSPGNRKIDVSMTLKQELEDIILELIDEDDNTVQSVFNGDVLKAENMETARQSVVSQLIKLGNSPFLLKEFLYQLDLPYFIPLGQLNQFRREAIELLIQKRYLHNPKFLEKIEPTTIPYPTVSLDYRGNVSNSYARKFYQRHGVEYIESAFETAKEPNLSNRVVMTTKHCIKYQLDACPKFQGMNSAYNKPLFIRDQHHTYELEFKCSECIMEVRICK